MRWIDWLTKTRLSGAEKLVKQCRAESAALELRLASDRRELESLRSRIESAEARWQSDLEKAEQVHKRSQEAIEALNAKVMIYEETTIPTLVASGKLLQARYDAETAVEIRKQVALTGGHVEEV